MFKCKSQSIVQKDLRERRPNEAIGLNGTLTDMVVVFGYFVPDKVPIAYLFHLQEKNLFSKMLLFLILLQFGLRERLI